jgi:hypothetical protein
MRYPQFISPSALSKYQEGPEKYYLQYLADNPPPKEPQNQAMSIGSSFDAYVKSYLFNSVMGRSDPQFELKTIFESQVEEQNRDWAWDAGAYAFEEYKNCGALADLLVELEQASGEPRFEFTVKNNIGGVDLLGKPDVWYLDKYKNPIILDFKVNGFCSDYGASPKRGYLRVRGPGNNQDGEHTKAMVSKINNVKVNIAEFFEAIDKSWAQQLCTYAWLCGAEVGSFFIVAIDQLCCKPSSGEYPTIRVAEHRSQIGPDFQHMVWGDYKALWDKIYSEPFHFFFDKTLEESKKRCDVLDMQHAAYTNGNNWIKDLMK